MSIARPNDDNPCLYGNVSLGIDQACLSILNMYQLPITLYTIAWEAYWGTGMLTATLPPNSNTSLTVSSKYPLHMYYKSDYEYCHTTYTFKEHGRYGWNLSQAEICSYIYTIHEPINSYLPILAAFAIFAILASIWTTSKVIVKVVRGRVSPDNVHDDLDRLQETESSTYPIIITTRSSTRIRSVDTFRGIAILLMIFVNNGGGGYAFFHHSPWFGLTVADLVLPWFAWIMGLTITISKRAELRVTIPRVKIICRCFQRALILILLGLVVNSMDSKSLNSLRFPGVLQLLAVSYFICATLETIFMKAYSQDNALQFGRFTIIGDILDSWPQWLIIGMIVLAHTLITFLLPVPGCPTGYLGPGGQYAYRGKFSNCTAGAAGYIDRLVFGNHMYSKNENTIFGPIARYDPEGIMNTLSAVLIVYVGVHAGKILLHYYQCNSRVIRWLLWSAFVGIIAGILCNFDKTDGVIPVSKRIMSLSFVLATSSFAFLLYTILYFLIDYKQCWSGAPFIYAGTNPIVLYVGHILTRRLFPWEWEIADPTHWSLLAMNLWTTALWNIIAYFLYRKDIIVTV